MTLPGGTLIPPEAFRRIRDNTTAGRYMPAKLKRRLRCPRPQGAMTGIELDGRNHRSNDESVDDDATFQTQPAHSIKLVTDRSGP